MTFFVLTLTCFISGGDLNYPGATRVEVTENLHGVAVTDPYRWMEDMESPATQAWVDQQELFLENYLENTALKTLQQRIQTISHNGRYGLPQQVGEWSYYSHREAGEPQPTLWRRGGGETEQLLNPQQMEMGPNAILRGFNVSPQGRYLAYAVSQNRGRWSTLRIYDLIEKRHTVEQLKHYTGGSSLAWRQDGNAFFYQKFDPPAAGKTLTARIKNARIMEHIVGRHPQKDRLIYADAQHPERLYTISVGDQGRYLIVVHGIGSAKEQGIMVADLKEDQPKLRELVPELANFSFVGNSGDRFRFRTDHQASRGRLVEIKGDRSQPEHWREVIGQSGLSMISVVESGHNLIVTGTFDAKPVVRLYQLDGSQPRDVALPFSGMPWGLGGTEREAEFVYLSINGLFHPGGIYRLDAKSAECSPYLIPKLAFDPGQYQMKQVFYKSKDGTRVPMFIAGRKDVKPSADTPVFMYAYGAYGWSAFPWYQANMVAFMDLGGLYAMPGVRGGGEYGSAWHQAGIKLHKQNGIDDYIAAAQWLIKQGYTSAKKMVANGGSASGVLAAAAMTQKPELFAAGVIDIPNLDLLRFHVFTMGKHRIQEYGDPDKKEEFEELHKLSPYHNIKEQTCYPPTMVTVGEKDEVAAPMHGYKYVARRQHLTNCGGPALLNLVRNGGHGFGNSPKQRAMIQARQLAFLMKVLNLTMPEVLAQDAIAVERQLGVPVDDN